jgi:outer membrane protein assembly factor BamD (BamD/ComL family)
VSARRQQGEARALALSEVRALLQGLLDEFPGSSYADRVAENLAAVDRELGK